MTGLDKIINQILDEANNSASAILEEAREKAEEIMAAAALEADKAEKDIQEKSASALKSFQERMVSSSDLKRRTAILQAKQEIIASVMAKSYDTFLNKEDAQYFAIIEKMISKFALAQEGTIYFSPKDMARMPQGFEAVIQKIAADKGGSLTLSRETRNLEGGFVLAYGGIEENCSFKALFDSKRDELQDKIQAVLFS